MNTLIFKVNGENIKWVSGYEPTSGEKNYSKLRFEFDDEWKNVDSVTVLQYFDVSKPELVAGIEVKNMVAVAGISKELRNQSGILHVGVYGVKSDNPDVTLSSHIAFVPVGKGVNFVGTEYTTFVQELLEYIARLEGRLIDKDNPVTTEFLKNGAVTGEKIALNAIEDKHLLEPFWKIKTLTVRTSNDIDSVFEHEDAEKSIYCINFSGLSSFASVAGEDNYIGLVDVTTEKITLLNKKEGVLWRYVKGSGNLEKKYSEIRDGAVDTSKLADRSVTGMKIGLEEISDEHLMWKYLKTREALAYDETMLHHFLVRSSDELARPYEHIYVLLTKGLDRLACIGAGRCIGVFSDADKFVIHNLWTNKRCMVTFNEENIVSIEPVKFDPNIADGAVDTSKLTDGAVDSSKLADGAINRIELFSLDFLAKYLSMPMSTKSVTGTITDDVYNSLTETGIYNVGSSSGQREMLVVYKLSSAHVVQVKYLTDKVFFRGIHASTDNVFSAEKWGTWTDITEDKYFRYATTFYTIEQLKGYGFQRGVTYSFFTSAEIAEKVGEGFCVGAIRPTIDSNVLELFNFSTGVNWRVNLSSGTEERLTANNAEQDFVNAGNFASLSELKDYEFEYEKIYKLEIESDIVTDNNVTIDAGVYICRHYWSPPHIYDADCLELTPFVTNGKSWTIDLESGNGFLTDKLTDFATFKYVDSTIDNVNIQISGINTQLEGLDELLASI